MRVSVAGVLTHSTGTGTGTGDATIYLLPNALHAGSGLAVGAYAFVSIAAAAPTGAGTGAGNGVADSKSTVAAVPVPTSVVLARIDLYTAGGGGAVAADATTAAATTDAAARAWICAELAFRLQFTAGAHAERILTLRVPAIARSALPPATRVMLLPPDAAAAPATASASAASAAVWNVRQNAALLRVASTLLVGRVVSAGQSIAVEWFRRTARFRVLLATGTGTGTGSGDTKSAPATDASAIAASLPPAAPIFLISPQTQIHFSTSAPAPKKPAAAAVSGGAAAEAKWIGRVTSVVCGVEREVTELVRAIRHPLTHAHLFESWRVWPTHCFLLHGLPGCGKTALAHAITTHSGLAHYTIAGAALYSKYRGDSERALQDVFDRARRTAPAIVVIDELDALSPASADAGIAVESDSGGVEQRIVAQLRAILDELNRPYPIDADTNSAAAAAAVTAAPARPHVFVIATTNRLFGVDSSLRRSGRFERLIELRAPNARARFLMLNRHCHAVPFHVPDASASAAAGAVKSAVLNRVSELTHGFVGADIERLCRDAVLFAMRRVTPSQPLGSAAGSKPAVAIAAAPTPPDWSLRESDFVSVLRTLRPANLSSTEFSSVPPPAPAADSDPFRAIGGCDSLIAQLRRTLVAPLQFPERFARFGVRPPRGVLLYGPSGCGKTALAMATAAACRAQVLCVHSTQLVSSIVGDSERAVSALFASARASAPCVLIIDQIEVLAPARNGGGSTAAATATAKPAADEKASPLIDPESDSETDAAEPDASDGGGGGSTQFDRILSTLLTDMDGILTPSAGASAARDVSGDGSESDPDTDADADATDSDRRDAAQHTVIVIGTTSMPHRVDPAMLRAGRLDQHIFVPPPDQSARRDICHKLTQNVPIQFVAPPPTPAAPTATAVASAPASDSGTQFATRNDFLLWLSAASEHYSGADLSAVCKEAAMRALRTDITAQTVQPKHFHSALQSTPPSLKHIQIHHPTAASLAATRN